MKNIFLFLIAILLFTACQKQPTANFNFDKSTYNAGETVHLTDASTNAHRWYWVMPDGSSQTSKNVDYIIGANDVDKPFTLITTSRNGKKVSSIPKTIDANHFIFNSDFFAFNFFSQWKLIPSSKLTQASNGNWIIYAEQGDKGYIKLFLPGNQPPSSTTIYTVVSNTTLNSNQAYIEGFTRPDIENFEYYNSVSGQLTITVLQNHHIQATFDSVLTTGNGLTYISGNITCN